MTTTETPTELDFDALAADAEQRLAELRQQEERLSLPALEDPAGAEAHELRSIREEITSKVELLEQSRAAGRVKAQREQEAAQQAEEKRLAAAQRKVDVAERDLAKAARALDEGMEAFAVALASYIEREGAVRRTVNEAGGRGSSVRTPASRFEAALVHHLSRARVPRGAIELPLITGKPRPMVLEERV
jgi:hypothetical protein